MHWIARGVQCISHSITAAKTKNSNHLTSSLFFYGQKQAITPEVTSEFPIVQTQCPAAPPVCPAFNIECLVVDCSCRTLCGEDSNMNYNPPIKAVDKTK